MCRKRLLCVSFVNLYQTLLLSLSLAAHQIYSIFQFLLHKSVITEITLLLQAWVKIYRYITFASRMQNSKHLSLVDPTGYYVFLHRCFAEVETWLCQYSLKNIYHSNLSYTVIRSIKSGTGS